MDISVLQEHALSLAGDITVVIQPGIYPPTMLVAERRIIVPPVTDIPTYLTTLHEIGHVVLGHTEDVRRSDIMKAERAAWDWAVDHALIVGEEGKIYIDWCLSTYARAVK